MIKIQHRVNTLKQLQETPAELGVEMDLHAYGNRLVVHHDPMTDGVDFAEWLEHYQHRFVILNIKEAGIESRVRTMVLDKGIKDFFMLDLSFPSLIKMVKNDEPRVAVRVSDYEPIESALSLKGKAEWVWIDLFKETFPLSKSQYDQLKAAGYKLCLVSPELHGRESESIRTIAQTLKENNFVMDAVCTKQPELW